MSAPPRARSAHGFRYVAAAMRQRMREGAWPAGFRVPSLRDLADQLGAGVKSVRLAVQELKRQGLLTLDRRRRVVVAGSASGWVPTPKPILLVLGGQLSSMLCPPFSRDFLEGLFEGVERNNHELLVYQGKPARTQLSFDLTDRPLQGVVLFGMFGRRVVGFYQDLECPVVVADRPLPVPGVHRILVDNINGGLAATTRLFEAGHRRIALLYHPDPDSNERRMGYIAAHKRSGVERPLHAVVTPAKDRDAARAAVRRIFLGKNPCTAVFSTGESNAKWLEQELARLGRHVPRDVSIVCFQTKTIEPARVSGQAVDFKEMGRRAYALLRTPKLPARLVRVPCEWVEGSTCAHLRDGG